MSGDRLPFETDYEEEDEAREQGVVQAMDTMDHKRKVKELTYEEIPPTLKAHLGDVAEANKSITNRTGYKYVHPNPRNYKQFIVKRAKVEVIFDDMQVAVLFAAALSVDSNLNTTEEARKWLGSMVSNPTALDMWIQAQLSNATEGSGSLDMDSLLSMFDEEDIEEWIQQEGPFGPV